MVTHCDILECVCVKERVTEGEMKMLRGIYL